MPIIIKGSGDNVIKPILCGHLQCSEKGNQINKGKNPSLSGGGNACACVWK